MAQDNNKTGSGNGIDQLVAGHDYDGIQEFNNPAPFWWQFFFYVSIVFGIGYFIYYQMLGGPTLKQELNEKMAKYEAMHPKESGPSVSEDSLKALLADSGRLANGQKVFVEKCSPCHAPDGGGLVGPNLVDNYWIHGKGTLKDIYTVVSEGVLDKGMPAWKQMITEAEVQDVVAFVKTLKGKPVANAKAPQGELVNE